MTAKPLELKIEDIMLIRTALLVLAMRCDKQVDFMLKKAQTYDKDISMRERTIADAEISKNDAKACRELIKRIDKLR